MRGNRARAEEGQKVELVDIDKHTEGTFFRCLHDEVPENPQMIALRRRWYDKFKDKGLRAKVLLREDKAVVGLCQYIPIEYSPFQGRDLSAILCIWVHGYEHLVGNQQRKGYGKFMLERIEDDARASGAKGVAAWGMDFPYWNPVSFYEHMGYERVETRKPVVLCWKPMADDAKPPALVRPVRAPSLVPGKTKVTAFISGWCGGGCGVCVTAREAVAGLDDLVAYEEIDTSDRAVMRSWGIDDGVYLDDKPFRPYEPPWTSEELKAAIVKSSRSGAKKPS